MYAILKTGGKQYKAQVGDEFTIEKLEVAEGEKVQFDQVLLLDDGAAVTVGTPTIVGASVTAEVIAQERGPKIIVFKYKPKKRYRKKTGHRQSLTRVRIDAINAAGSVVAPVEA